MRVGKKSRTVRKREALLPDAFGSKASGSSFRTVWRVRPVKVKLPGKAVLLLESNQLSVSTVPVVLLIELAALWSDQ